MRARIDKALDDVEVLRVLHPTPFTLHSTPYTLPSTPFTLHHTSYTLHPTPLHLPYTLW